MHLIFKLVYRTCHKRLKQERINRMWATYWDSREESTLRAYGTGYKHLRRIVKEEGLSLFQLDEVARCVVVTHVKERGLGPGTLRQILAVIIIFN